MNYAEALKIVESEFETRYVAPNCQAIRINLTYDGYNGFYIAVCDSEGEAFLSDEGITKDVFCKAKDETEWRALCEANGFSFNRFWHIERRFTALSDMYEFIDFLTKVSDKYNRR